VIREEVHKCRIHKDDDDVVVMMRVDCFGAQPPAEERFFAKIAGSCESSLA